MRPALSNWFALPVALALAALLLGVPAALAEEPADDGAPAASDPADVAGAGEGESGAGENDDGATDSPDASDPAEPRGLTEIDGKLYYIEEDGTLFTGGYKPVTVDGARKYYYFTADGSAFTDGYIKFEQGGREYCFFFQEDGTAFTDGYKEIVLDGELCYFYFLANGQAFNTGYKTVMIEGKKYYFFFGPDCKAITGTMQSIDLSDRIGYFYLQDDGKAFADGYKELGEGEDKSYYYFLSNGQAYTTGYKVVKIDGVSQYFFFEEDGTAYTGGRKGVSFGTNEFFYCFGEDGKAVLDTVVEAEDGRYYYGPNGRACAAWFQENGVWVHAGSDGKFQTDGAADGYHVMEDGSCPTKEKMRELAFSLITEDMTDEEKIAAIYDWLVGTDMTYITNLDHARPDWTWYDGWVEDFALQLLDNNGGNCFRYAALLGLLVREATGLDVRIVTGRTPSAYGGLTAHGWIEVFQDGSWYIYDAEMVKFTPTFRRYRGFHVLHGTGYDYVPSLYHNIYG